jgi:hypothetical protein
MSALAAGALLVLATLAAAAAPRRDAPALAAAPIDGRDAPPALARFAATAPPLEAREPGLALAVNATEVYSAPRWVAVRWAGVREPSLDDWISLHYADAAPGAAPIKFQLAARAQGHLATGAGELAFRLLPAREDYAFQFLRGGLAAPRVAARTARIIAAAPNAPRQGRLAPTGRPGEVAVSWTTRDAGGAPAALWRAAAAGAGAPFHEAAAAASTTYTRAEMCGQPANTTGWADPGYTHTAVMAGLAPNTLYSYSFGDASSGEPFSTPTTFRAPPAPGAPAALLLVADLGQAEPDGALAAAEQGAAAATHARLAADAATGQYHLLMHAGDVSYARGFASQWENFFDAGAGAMRAVPHAYALRVGGAAPSLTEPSRIKYQIPKPTNHPTTHRSRPPESRARLGGGLLFQERRLGRRVRRPVPAPPPAPGRAARRRRAALVRARRRRAPPARLLDRARRGRRLAAACLPRRRPQRRRPRPHALGRARGPPPDVR